MSMMRSAGTFAQFEILNSTFSAINSNKNIAKRLLADDLIRKLGEISLDVDFVRFRQQNVESDANFKECKELLNFNESFFTK